MSWADAAIYANKTSPRADSESWQNAKKALKQHLDHVHPKWRGQLERKVAPVDEDLRALQRSTQNSPYVKAKAHDRVTGPGWERYTKKYKECQVSGLEKVPYVSRLQCVYL